MPLGSDVMMTGEGTRACRGYSRSGEITADWLAYFWLDTFEGDCKNRVIFC